MISENDISLHDIVTDRRARAYLAVECAHEVRGARRQLDRHISGTWPQARAFLSTEISARSNIDAASEADYLVIALLNIGIAMPRVARE